MISRELYKQIKSMNRTELDQYLSGLIKYNPQEELDKAYQLGLSNGLKMLSDKVTKGIESGIRKTKGIGEVRYNDLMTNIAGEIINLTKNNE